MQKFTLGVESECFKRTGKFLPGNIRPRLSRTQIWLKYFWINRAKDYGILNGC